MLKTFASDGCFQVAVIKLCVFSFC